MGSTIEEIIIELQNPASTLYLYIGAETDAGWTIAQTACGLAANAKARRVDSFSVVESILTSGNYVAVAFSWDGIAKCYLSSADAIDLNVVVGKIAEAQS
jgi:hypothetical protein